MSAIFAVYWLPEFGGTDSYDPPLQRKLWALFFTYSVFQIVNMAWCLFCGIYWPIWLHKPTQRWRRVFLIIQGVLLVLLVPFGACAVVYSAQGYYDDAANGWIEADAACYAVSIVTAIVTSLSE